MPNIVFLLLRRLRAPLIFLICVYAVAVIGLVLIPGVDAQGRPWRMDFFHAFYFVSFTGSTIGFGEIPFPFTAGQRLWVLVCIYFSVIAWLFAIAQLLNIIQDPAFQLALTRSTFLRGALRLKQRFYVVCGYGDTGALLVNELTRRRVRTVVIDNNPDRMNALELAGLDLDVPGLRADCALPDNLVYAGLQRSFCAGVVAVTNNDYTNLKVAISSKLLNPEIPVICRSEIHDVGLNMESFGTDGIINPFDIFGDRLAMALHSPAISAIYQWLTSPAGTPLRDPVFPPKGRYILCGYGRFGKAVEQFLSFEGVETTIVESRPRETGAPEGTIQGRGTEAVTLREAGIEQAVALIAGTDDDTNNLSIIMTARDLNPELFVIARQNSQENQAIYHAANVNVIMQRSDIIVREIVTRLTNPLLAEFLARLDKDDEESANVLASRIGAVAGDNAPATWCLTLTKAGAPALAIHLFRGGTARIGHLTVDPGNREQHLRCLPLLLQRGHDVHMFPERDMDLALGDRILFCGQQAVEHRTRWMVTNAKALAYILDDQSVSPVGYQLLGRFDR